MTPRRRVELAFGEYLDSLERKIGETVQEMVAKLDAERETEEILATPEALAAFRAGEADIKAGRLHDHADVLAELDTIGEAVSPAVEIEMRQHMVMPFKTARWECNLAGRWISGESIHTTTQDVRDNGNAWLADLGAKLGVKLVPMWED